MQAVWLMEKALLLLAATRQAERGRYENTSTEDVSWADMDGGVVKSGLEFGVVEVRSRLCR